MSNCIQYFQLQTLSAWVAIASATNFIHEGITGERGIIERKVTYSYCKLLQVQDSAFPSTFPSFFLDAIQVMYNKNTSLSVYYVLKHLPLCACNAFMNGDSRYVLKSDVHTYLGT